MARQKTLTAAFVKTVKEPGRYGDGRGSHGLYLRVWQTANGRTGRNWGQRLRIGGQVTNLGLGSWPLVTLANAREKSLENARIAALGNDPRIPVRSGPTFAEALEIVIGTHRQTWRDGGKTEKIWRASMAQYAMPILGSKPVDIITGRDVLAVLLPIWADKRQTALKIRRRVRAVMKWAVAHEYRQDDPAGDAISEALPRGGHQVQHQRALPFANVGAALATIRATNAFSSTKLAFAFLSYTAARSGEVRGADWTEIDLDSATWTIPAGRTKQNRAHRIPLSRQALDVLAQAQAIQDGSGLVFPSSRGKAMTDNTLGKLMRENRISGTIHGQRSSFRDWAAECTDVPREIAEHALGHVEGSASETAYRRTDYYLKRVDLMQAWADYISGQ